MLNITKTIENNDILITLEGRLDTNTAPELDDELRKVISDADSLTLDVEKLDYISSAGLRVLLFANRNMPNQGKMKVIHVNETIRGIFDITGFSDILTIE